MKKALILAAFVFAALCVWAQESTTSMKTDTLTAQQLLADYVSLNNQVAKFQKLEMASVWTGLAATALTAGSVLMSARETSEMLENAIQDHAAPETGIRTSQALQIAAGVVGVVSAALAIAGVTQLKRDRLEITPNGVVYRLGPSQREEHPKGYYDPSLREW